MDSHVLRKASWRLPALAGMAVLRFNTRGTLSAAGRSEGEFESGEGEGLDVEAAVAYATSAGLPRIWLLGWSFGTDLTLRHGLLPGVEGAILLSPPLRFSAGADLDRGAPRGGRSSPWSPSWTTTCARRRRSSASPASAGKGRRRRGGQAPVGR